MRFIIVYVQTLKKYYIISGKIQISVKLNNIILTFHFTLIANFLIKNKHFIVQHIKCNFALSKNEFKNGL